MPPPKTPEPIARVPETLVVHFRFADWLLDKSALLTLEKALRRLRENPTLVVQVEGHADNVGSPSQNLKLSERRAREVRRPEEQEALPEELVETLAALLAQALVNDIRQYRDLRELALSSTSPADDPVVASPERERRHGRSQRHRDTSPRSRRGAASRSSAKSRRSGIGTRRSAGRSPLSVNAQATVADGRP